MGAKSGKLLCCSEAQLASSLKQQPRLQDNMPSGRTTISAEPSEDEFEGFLVESQTGSSSPTLPKKSKKKTSEHIFDRFQLFSEATCSSTGSVEIQGSFFARFEVLVDQLFTFFQEKPYLQANNNSCSQVDACTVSNSIVNQAIDSASKASLSLQSCSFGSGIGAPNGGYERAYIEAKIPSELTIYLKRETSNFKRRTSFQITADRKSQTSDQSKFHRQASEQIICNQQSLDAFLTSIEQSDRNMLDYSSQVTKVQSEKIIFEHQFEDDHRYTLQIIHSIFHPSHFSSLRDLFYVKVTARLSQNVLVVASESISPSSLFESGEEEEIQLNNPRYTRIKRNSSTARIAQTYQCNLRKTYQPRVERADMPLSGNVITFFEESNTILVQQLLGIDMKIDKQHYVQKQVLLHFAKQKAEQIKLATSLATTNKQSS